MEICIKKRSKKIDWKRLVARSIEDGMKKGIELIIIAVLLGATFKLLVTAIPAVVLGSVIAKLAKIKIFG